MSKYLWLAVTMDKYEFPLFVCDSARELAVRCGTTEGTILSQTSRYRKGKVKKTPYRMVKI